MPTRYRGDTQPLKITITKNNSPLDLNDVIAAELAILKEDTTVVIQCVKDADLLSGVVYANFSATDLDTVGIFKFDVQVTFLDNTKTTLVVDYFNIEDDVNKT